MNQHWIYDEEFIALTKGCRVERALHRSKQWQDGSAQFQLSKIPLTLWTKALKDVTVVFRLVQGLCKLSSQSILALSERPNGRRTLCNIIELPWLFG